MTAALRLAFVLVCACSPLSFVKATHLRRHGNQNQKFMRPVSTSFRGLFGFPSNYNCFARIFDEPRRLRLQCTKNPNRLLNCKCHRRPKSLQLTCSCGKLRGNGYVPVELQKKWVNDKAVFPTEPLEDQRPNLVVEWALFFFYFSARNVACVHSGCIKTCTLLPASLFSFLMYLGLFQKRCPPEKSWGMLLSQRAWIMLTRPVKRGSVSLDCVTACLDCGLSIDLLWVALEQIRAWSQSGCSWYRSILNSTDKALSPTMGVLCIRW